MNIFRTISNVYKVPEETLISIQKNLELKRFSKKELFIKEGEYQKKFFFLTSGIARAYIVDENGKEFTRSLFTPPTAMASIKALKTEAESKVNFDCLTDCEMYVGDYDEFIKLTQTNIKISNLYSKMLEKAYLKIEERVYELTLNAQEKYLNLKKRIPEIENLIPQYQIATYLNITNVQLSRIRKKMLGR